MPSASIEGAAEWISSGYDVDDRHRNVADKPSRRGKCDSSIGESKFLLIVFHNHY